MSALRKTAYHEAGHVVAAIMQGRRVDRVSIVPNDNTLGHMIGMRIPAAMKKVTYIDGADLSLRDMKALEDWIVVKLAGPEAEYRVSRRRNHIGASGDYEGAVTLALMIHVGNDDVATAYLKYLSAVAESFVTAHWRSIERLAEALIERKTLSGRDARRVLFGHIEERTREVMAALAARPEGAP